MIVVRMRMMRRMMRRMMIVMMKYKKYTV